MIVNNPADRDKDK